MSFSDAYLAEARHILTSIDATAVERVAGLIAETAGRNGRIFFLGVGGGAGHASHAVNDFRKICGIECYSPSDNVSELTARINDDGWETCYAEWLKVSRLNSRDLVFVFSVGGGNKQKKVSLNLVHALDYAREAGAVITGIVGRDGGFTVEVSSACVIVPPLAPERVTPHTEAFQAVLWHLLVSHPKLQKHAMKWESVK